MTRTGRAGRKWLAGLLPLLLFFGATPAVAQHTVVVLVRHAETADGPAGDPGLSAAGERRARALAEALPAAGVAAVFTTHYERTRQTAAPTLAATGATARVVEVDRSARMQHVEEIAAAIEREFAGRSVLVVGHSNTVPQLIAALGGPAVPPIADNEYDRLYVLTIDAAGTRVVASRY